jgi:hypothetical protein
LELITLLTIYLAAKADGITEIITAAQTKETLDKEQQFNFGVLIKKHTSQIFNQQKALLERMKKLKKDYIAQQSK